MKTLATKLRPAGWCWFGLSVYIITADTFLIIQERKGKEQYCTMSTSFRYALAHPMKRWPVILIWGLVTFHLFDWFFPEPIQKYEPIRFLGQKVAKPQLEC